MKNENNSKEQRESADVRCSTCSDLLSKISKDIICIEFEDDQRFGSAFDKFFDVMRKYNICAGTKSPDGVGITFNNYEWTMCRTLFESRIKDYFTMKFLIDELPEDIESY